MVFWGVKKLPELTDKISAILKLLGMAADDSARGKLEEYIKLLVKWNKAYNLTAVRDIDQMLEKHLLDSLSIAPFIDGERWIDVGTGAGLPGIPLAIMLPQQEITLLDSNGKKTRFLQQVKNQLALDNVTVVNERVETFRPEQAYDAVLSRAFASLADMLAGSEHFCAASGHFYAMKGQYPESELQEIKKPYKVLPITWPGNHFDRHLIIISQSPRG